jgi:hypothetical protein
VQFLDGGSALGEPVELEDGIASFRTSVLGIGGHALTAAFQPLDPTRFAASSSAGVLVNVTDSGTGTPGQGPKGDKGDPGEKGDTGDAGPAGPSGTNGTNGVDGRDGAIGPVGPAGAKGEKGDRGLNGRDALVTCKITGSSSSQRITCSVTYGARAASARTQARLLRSGRTYAKGRLGGLRATRKVARGSYQLRFAQGGKTVSAKVAVR